MTFTDYEVVQPTDDDLMLCSFSELGPEIVGRKVIIDWICDEVGTYKDGTPRFERAKCRLISDMEDNVWDEWAEEVATITSMVGPGRFEVSCQCGKKIAFMTQQYYYDGP